MIILLHVQNSGRPQHEIGNPKIPSNNIYRYETVDNRGNRELWSRSEEHSLSRNLNIPTRSGSIVTIQIIGYLSMLMSDACYFNSFIIVDDKFSIGTLFFSHTSHVIIIHIRPCCHVIEQ